MAVSAPSAPFPAERLVQDDFRGFMILEKTTSGTLRQAWAYPGGGGAEERGLAAAVAARASFVEPLLSRHGDVWHYSFPLMGGGGGGGGAGGSGPSLLPSAALPRTQAASAVVLSRSFAPEPFLTLAKVLVEGYVATGGSTACVTAAWLAAFASQRVPRAFLAPQAALSPPSSVPSSTAAAGLGAAPDPASVAWDASAFDLSKTYRAAGVRALLSALGVEAILVWTALMLRARVAVLAPTPAEAIRAVRVLPLLVAHRFIGLPAADGASSALAAQRLGAGTASPCTGPASIMVPFVALSAYHLTPEAEGGGAAAAAGGGGGGGGNALTLSGPASGPTAALLSEGWRAQEQALSHAASPGGWVGGFTDPGVSARGGDLWDVLVDIRPGNVGVTAADASKAALGLPLSPLHRGVAVALGEALADPQGTDASALAALHGKANALVSQLRGWFPNGAVHGASASAAAEAAALSAAAAAQASAAAAEGGGAEAAAAEAAVAAALRPDAVVSPFLATLVAAGVPASAHRFLWGVAALDCGPGPAALRV